MIGKGNIIWLASYPKSGNTWVRIFLIHLLHATKNIDLNNLSQIRPSSYRRLFDEHAGVESSDLTFEEIQSIKPRVYEILSSAHKEPFFMKAHDALSQAPGNKDLILSSKASRGAIYIMRNPLDVAVSLASFMKISIDSAIAMMNDSESLLNTTTNSLSPLLPVYMGSWSHHVSSWIHQDKIPVLLVRYEDLLEDPIQQFTKVVEFAKLSFSPEAIRIATEKCSFQNLKMQELRGGFREKLHGNQPFFRFGQKDNWKQVLKKGQIDQLLSDHSVMMGELNYDNF